MTKEERLQRDIDRLAAMRAHEDELRQQGYEYIAGIDEVGRGPLAGPVYAACVLLPPDFEVLGIYDSKKLSAKKRDELAAVIKEKAVAYGIGIADNKEIDEINILEATKLAMARAVEQCNNSLKSKINRQRDHDDLLKNDKPHCIEYLIVDALELELRIPCEGIVKGDEKSLSIAAASIVAKVARDKYMEEMDAEYPGYDLASNKGYGTAAHYKGLKDHGISDIHRRSFLKKFEETREATSIEQKEKSRDNKMSKKVYAVKKGRTTGLFMSWEDCKAQVDGYKGAEYKSFTDPDDAMIYLGLSGGGKGYGNNNSNTRDNKKSGSNETTDAEEMMPQGNRAYVDGSYDSSSNRFSCGVVIIETDANGVSETTELKAVFEDDVAALQRNVAGEVMGAKTAIDYCMENGIDEIEIYHDYEGVGKWADGLWKANNPLTQGYKQFIADARRHMNIRFVKVKAHAGNKYNEMADKLAKSALDL